MHLLYEIARAKSIGILRGGAPAPAKVEPAIRVPLQPMVSGDQVQLTAQLEEMKELLDAKDSLLDAKDSAIEELKLQLHESSVEEPASLRPPVAAMVDSFMSSLPTPPFAASALAASTWMCHGHVTDVSWLASAPRRVPPPPLPPRAPPPPRTRAPRVRLAPSPN